MLNARALGELLSQNSDQRLCKRWFLMTPNGTLLAHSQTENLKDLRKGVTAAALSWQEQNEIARHLSGSSEGTFATASAHLHTLIFESASKNVLIRKLQPQLLLVLEGGVPPRKPSFEVRITVEGADGQPLRRHAAGDSSPSASVSSKAESSMSTATAGVLALHRRKLDAMAEAILNDFEQTGFKMPENGADQLF